MPAKIHLD